MGTTNSGRFLISYDHETETPAHRANVLAFCGLLRAEGLDVHIDADVEGERQDWSLWMTHEIVAADRVLMVVSPRYRLRFEADAPIGGGRGVEIEAKIIREEIARDPAGSLRKFVPVLLPGAAVVDIPTLLQPYTATHWRVPELTGQGAADLVRLLRRLPHAPSAPPAPTEIDDGIGALWLTAAVGSPAVVTDVVAAFTAGDETTAVTAFAAGDGGTALRTGAPPEIVAHLLRLARTLPPILDRHRGGGMPIVTIGAHVDRGPVAATAGAQWVATSPVVARLHAEPRVSAVVAVSQALYGAMSGVPASLLAAYRTFRRDGAEGEPVHLSALGLARCPDPPQATAAQRAGRGATTTITGTHGQVYVNSVDNRIDNSDSFTIVAGRDVVAGE
jgi:hypothetical protein